MMKRSATNAYQMMARGSALVLAALVVAVLTCMLCTVAAGIPARANAATSTTVQIKVEQKFKSDVTGVNSKFLYHLEAQTPGAPMPRGTKDGVYTWSMKDSVKKTVDIELAGVERNVPFTYKMYQVPPKDTEGYILDNTVYYPEVTLLGNGVPRYIVRLEDGTKPSKLVWAAEYDSSTVGIGDDDTPTDVGDGDDDDPSINDGDTPTDGSSNDDPDVDEDDDDDVDVDDGDTPTSPVSTGDALMLGVCGLLVVSLAGAAFALRMRDRKEDDRD